MPNLDELSYDNLVAGDADIVTEPITIDVSQTILRGDVLIKASGKYQRPAAAITEANFAIIAAENITTDATSTVASIGYKTGRFNSNVMRFGGTSTVDDNFDILEEKSIYLTKAQR